MLRVMHSWVGEIGILLQIITKGCFLVVNYYSIRDFVTCYIFHGGRVGVFLSALHVLQKCYKEWAGLLDGVM